MCLLSDHDITSRCTLNSPPMIDPFEEHLLGPSSYDFTLGNNFKAFKMFGDNDKQFWIDPQEEQEMVDLRVEDGDHLWLPPDGFLLAESKQYVRIPTNLAGRMEGKSSLGRIGLMVHSTAGFFDPGFHGIATLEMHNVSGGSIKLRPGMRICQMAFMEMSRIPKNPYDGKYQGQTKVTESRSHLDKEVADVAE